MGHKMMQLYSGLAFFYGNQSFYGEIKCSLLCVTQWVTMCWWGILY